MMTAKQKKTILKRKKAITNTAKKNRRLSSKIAIQYVLPLGNGWVVKSSNAAQFFAITDSKRQAVSIAENLAKTKHTEVIVHGRSGKIEMKKSYAK